ncbi:hypothetical protein [Nocardia brasiliensis]|uniref:hypothetical protein n=1 Tax=Nocardia brasiliensis TaxID=37326 RepID=UPI00366EC406
MLIETSPAADTRPHSGNAALAVLKRRWPTLVGVVVALALPVATPDASWIGAVILIAAAVAYPLFGAYRRHLHGRNLLLVQAISFVAFIAVAVVVLLIDETVGRYLLAGGFLAHAAWDFAHHRADRMVPRWYAEFCAVVDVLVAVVLVLAPLL